MFFKKTFFIFLACLGLMSASAHANLTNEQRAICMASARAYADMWVDEATEYPVWLDYYGTELTDCYDRFLIGGYIPGEGTCTHYPC